MRPGPVLALLGALIALAGHPAARAGGAAAAGSPAAGRSALSLASDADDLAVAPPGLYERGERLTFAVYWFGIGAGTAVLEARGPVEVDGRRAYHFVTAAESSPLVSVFYRVRDRNEAFLDAALPRSLRFDKHLREGRYRHDSSTAFDHEAGQATFRYIDYGPLSRSIETLEEALRITSYRSETFPVPPSVLDELSALYILRTRPLAVGETLRLVVLASRKAYEAEFRVTGRETLETELGAIPTLVVEPLIRFEGIFQRKARVVLWLSDDARRIPVRIQTKVRVGTFTAVLIHREVGTAPGGGPP